ncbi:MAG: bifunctional DNA primase/polymerase [Streptomyces sp.]|uniref:bifunctional DNA primase/polymerase n=1 Tax=Streptomyces sp. TaxID=1931 RepID=UPI003D6C5B29
MSDRKHHTPGPSGPSRVTSDGADWLASASAFPGSVHALWRHRPAAPRVLPCGTAFDVVSTPPLLGRRILDRLWTTGPGSGPVAIHRGRVLLFTATGTAQRLPALLSWKEWREPARQSLAPLLCHGLGETVTVPALHPGTGPATAVDGPSRWLVAPDRRHPWLPGPEILLRAALRSVRAGRGPATGPTAGPTTTGQSIFTAADRGVKVYDVTRRR